MSGAEAVLYVKEGCPYCMRLAGELKAKGVAFREVDVSRNAAELRELKRKYRATKVPVLVVGEEVTIGYNGNG